VLAIGIPVIAVRNGRHLAVVRRSRSSD
jgi:hypothetical protein